VRAFSQRSLATPRCREPPGPCWTTTYITSTHHPASSAFPARRTCVIHTLGRASPCCIQREPAWCTLEMLSPVGTGQQAPSLSLSPGASCFASLLLSHWPGWLSPTRHLPPHSGPPGQVRATTTAWRSTQLDSGLSYSAGIATISGRMAHLATPGNGTEHVGSFERQPTHLLHVVSARWLSTRHATRACTLAGRPTVTRAF